MRWKRIVGAAALLIFLTIVAMFVILSRYDFNDLKPQIARVTKEATGRELKLTGDIDLKIGLTPKLLVENPCLTAIEEAHKGVKATKEKPPGEKGTVTKTIDGAKESIKDFGKKLKGLFGN